MQRGPLRTAMRTRALSRCRQRSLPERRRGSVPSRRLGGVRHFGGPRRSCQPDGNGPAWCVPQWLPRTKPQTESAPCRCAHRTHRHHTVVAIARFLAWPNGQRFDVPADLVKRRRELTPSNSPNVGRADFRVWSKDPRNVRTPFRALVNRSCCAGLCASPAEWGAHLRVRAVCA